MQLSADEGTRERSSYASADAHGVLFHSSAVSARDTKYFATSMTASQAEQSTESSGAQHWVAMHPFHSMGPDIWRVSQKHLILSYFKKQSRST